MLLTLCIIATVVLGVHYLVVIVKQNPQYTLFTNVLAGLIVGAMLMGLPIVTIWVLYVRLP